MKWAIVGLAFSLSVVGSAQADETINFDNLGSSQALIYALSGGPKSGTTQMLTVEYHDVTLDSFFVTEDYIGTVLDYLPEQGGLYKENGPVQSIQCSFSCMTQPAPGILTTNFTAPVGFDHTSDCVANKVFALNCSLSWVSSSTFRIVYTPLANDAYIHMSLATIPEPDAWSLMMVGFGGLGAVLRRRRQRLLAS